VTQCLERFVVSPIVKSRAGLLISIIAIDSDTIGDTFEVSLSLSAILFFDCIAIAIGDTFFDSIAIDYRDTFREYR
jgi:hypothetical protein